jgi:hypothetical protein
MVTEPGQYHSKKSQPHQRLEGPEKGNGGCPDGAGTIRLFTIGNKAERMENGFESNQLMPSTDICRCQ